MSRKIKSDVDRIHAVIKKSLVGKIPQLNGTAPVYLPQIYFQRLSDIEFIVLWELKDLKIEVNQRTADYIDQRRKQLGLHREMGSEVIPKAEFTLRR